jgi:hypothetical protein
LHSSLSNPYSGKCRRSDPKRRRAVVLKLEIFVGALFINLRVTRL